MIKQVLLAYGQGLTVNGFEVVPADYGCGTKAITTDGPSFVYVLCFESPEEPRYGDNQEPLIDALFLASTVPGVPPLQLDKRVLRRPSALELVEQIEANYNLPDLQPPSAEELREGTALDDFGDDGALPNDDTPKGLGLD